MTANEFIESLDIANDKRTYINFIKLPFIVLIRVPIVLIIWFFVWLGEYLEDDSHIWWQLLSKLGWQRK